MTEIRDLPNHHPNKIAAREGATLGLIDALRALSSHIGRTDLAWERTDARRRVEIEDRLKRRAQAAIDVAASVGIKAEG